MTPSSGLRPGGPTEVFSRLASAHDLGEANLLLLITDIEGTGARSRGTPMAVLADGSHVGSFSSGCVESAIVAEALKILEEAAPRSVRLGSGSPYFDIQLPCGGGMDVLFLPNPDPIIIYAISRELEARRPVDLRIDGEGGLHIGGSSNGEDKALFEVRYVPPLKLVLVGHGEEVRAAAKLGLAFGAEVEVFSPDNEVITFARDLGLHASELTSPARGLAVQSDPWTAFLFLFHDHDWEPPLLASILPSEAFWVGAMGSRRTHATRLEALAGLGVSADDLARVRGPVGVTPSSRDPSMLALSALGEIASAYDAID